MLERERERDQVLQDRERAERGDQHDQRRSVALRQPVVELRSGSAPPASDPVSTPIAAAATGTECPAAPRTRPHSRRAYRCRHAPRGTRRWSRRRSAKRHRHHGDAAPADQPIDEQLQQQHRSHLRVELHQFALRCRRGGEISTGRTAVLDVKVIVGDARLERLDVEDRLLEVSPVSGLFSPSRRSIACTMMLVELQYSRAKNAHLLGAELGVELLLVFRRDARLDRGVIPADASPGSRRTGARTCVPIATGKPGVWPTCSAKAAWPCVIAMIHEVGLDRRDLEQASSDSWSGRIPTGSSARIFPPAASKTFLKSSLPSMPAAAFS